MPGLTKNTSIYVTTRDGKHENLDLNQIQYRIFNLSEGLQIQQVESATSDIASGIEPVCVVKKTFK